MSRLTESAIEEFALMAGVDLRWFPSSRGCESILKAYKNRYLKIINLLIFMICTEYKPRFVLQILNTFTISGAWEPGEPALYLVETKI